MRPILLVRHTCLADGTYNWVTWREKRPVMKNTFYYLILHILLPFNWSFVCSLAYTYTRYAHSICDK